MQSLWSTDQLKRKLGDIRCWVMEVALSTLWGEICDIGGLSIAYFIPLTLPISYPLLFMNVFWSEWVLSSKSICVQVLRVHPYWPQPEETTSSIKHCTIFRFISSEYGGPEEQFILLPGHPGGGPQPHHTLDSST